MSTFDHTTLIQNINQSLSGLRKAQPEAMQGFGQLAKAAMTEGAVSEKHKELIALAQSRPGKILFGTSGAGSGTHMTTEIFNMNAGIKTVHVAFKGLPEVMIEVAAGRLNYGIISMGASMPFIQEKRVTPLAVVAVKRSPLLPDVPTVTEILPSFERDASHGIIAPAGTPKDVLNIISRDVARALEFPDVKERMDAMGFERVHMGPEEYTKLLRRLHASLTKTVVAVGLRAP